MAKLTPMMQQYRAIKERYKDCILFFRLGDFYEMFFEDAELASRELEIALTARDCGLEERAPMCGVPYHSAHTYLAKLIAKGYKVAICEQMEDPAMAKGLVKRDVTRVVTPGTVIDPTMLEDKKNNFLMCIYCRQTYFGIAVVDITTGEFFTTQITWGSSMRKLLDETARFKPSEIITNAELTKKPEYKSYFEDYLGIRASILPDQVFEPAFCDEKILSLFKENPLKDLELAKCATGALLEYIESTQKTDLTHIEAIQPYKIEQYMIIDSASRRNLEITETMRDARKKGSLLWVLDKTSTAMGGRMLRRWLEQPLMDVDEIQMRLDAVEELKNGFMVRNELMDLLRGVYDIERLAGKLVFGTINARDLVSLKISLSKLPYIREMVAGLTCGLNAAMAERLDPLEDIVELIERAIADDPPLSVKEGGIIKEGYHEEVDRLRKATTEGKNWIAEMEARERERTGIKSLKIRYNENFGYYIEVTKANIGQVPEDYVRKQTLVNCERFTTEALAELEKTILGAEKKVVQLEYELFCQLRDAISSHVKRLKATAHCIAELDALCSLAEVADRNNYVKPQVYQGGVIEIQDGRHPVVEKMLSDNSFVPNDTWLDMEDNRIAIITGPNMAGKSTYMRQVALIVLMAQAGSFVPASYARIGLVDRIFTRVGASDDLASGQSTFMVEMSEVANILSNATPNSLLILDEIGRGTSTHDGLSIAWAVIEYINDRARLGSRTLFATHYHELTELEDKLHGIKNYCVSVRKKGDDIIFLRKISRGGADRSYGVEVAKLAGIPDPVIQRARVILEELDEADINKNPKRKKEKPVEGQLDLFASSSLTKAERDVLDEIRALDPSNLTPLDALNKLYSLQQKLK
ncbi:DNA mismatch repair protein MutS [Thermoclostridium caenicola]|uniref:DNA mismatch repair protein MutS n=1 Tax=Thermoclostridium caenicola TaxID=659425 RepID=A0A1M6JU04_9FIRM|nr:DNA mismatch repair protein MutS [Thermoclostridium caenicola]SHJ50161.1 DNA mismatch repair protein MutS [Thermoclostridium caenicola]